MFEILRDLLKKQSEENKKNTADFIRNGYCDSWAPEHKTPSDDGVKRYSTGLRWTQYQEGKINRDNAVNLAIKRADKKAEKTLASKLEKLETAATAPDVTGVSISIEWTRSRTWGNNPTATITVYTGTHGTQYTGTASGCGYDKESAAVADAINRDPSIMKMLYQVKENALATMAAPATVTEWNDGNGKYIAYGAGYGVLPYFEGGTGMSAFYNVFQACGLDRIAENHGTRYDYYEFGKKA